MVKISEKGMQCNHNVGEAFERFHLNCYFLKERGRMQMAGGLLVLVQLAFLELYLWKY